MLRTLGILLTLVVVLGVGVPTRANPDASAPPALTQSSPTYDLLVAAGLYEVLEKQRVENVRRAHQQISQTIEQVRQSFPELSADYFGQLEKLVMKAYEELGRAYTTEESLRVYAAVIDKNYGDENARALEQLSTPEGQQLAATISEALSETIRFQMARTELVLERSIKEYQAGLREIIADVKAKRR